VCHVSVVVVTVTAELASCTRGSKGSADTSSSICGAQRAQLAVELALTRDRMHDWTLSVTEGAADCIESITQRRCLVLRREGRTASLVDKASTRMHSDAPHLQHGEQRREGGVDDGRQRGAVVLVLELVLARQHPQHVQRAPHLIQNGLCCADHPVG